MYVILDRYYKPRMVHNFFSIEPYPPEDTKENQMGLGLESLKNIVNKEVALKIAMEEQFTAYDITKAIREYIKYDFAHDDSRDFVHALLDDKDGVLVKNSYVKTSMRLPTGVHAFVFHDEFTDPEDYVANMKVDNTYTPDSTLAADSQVCIDNLREDFDDLRNIALEVVSCYRNDSLEELSESIKDLESTLKNICN